jgi:hypothetical protein
MAEVMTPDHHEWERFYDLLQGPEGCDFKDGENGITWTCKGGTDTSLALAILDKHFPTVDKDASVEHWSDHGGHCDCEILFNVDPRD